MKIVKAIGFETIEQKEPYYAKLQKAENVYDKQMAYIRVKDERDGIQRRLEQLKTQIGNYEKEMVSYC